MAPERSTQFDPVAEHQRVLWLRQRLDGECAGRVEPLCDCTHHRLIDQIVGVRMING